jgi:single-stranded-DNA-specific exonuclease
MQNRKRTLLPNTPWVPALPRGDELVISSVTGLRQQLLLQRGVEAETQEKFLRPNLERDIHNPHLLYGLEEAVDRIFQAIAAGESIIVFGDYDVDGVSGTAILLIALRELGAKVSPYIPHRLSEGYGLSIGALQRILPECDLLLTVDCGVTNVEEVEWVKRAGKDVVVIDHHSFLESGELPAARAIIHPRHPQGSYPFGYLAAAGVAWKVAAALLADSRSGLKSAELAVQSLLDLAVLGTVADMVPLLGENRVVAHYGLRLLARTSRPGLRALLQEVGVWGEELMAEHIAWRVAPRLNAAGKVDHAQPALDLLLAVSKQEAEELVASLNVLNRQRQALTSKIMQEAEEQLIPDEPVVVVFNLQWPAGVVGLAAGKLAEKYGKPAIVIGGSGVEAVGSARGPAGSNVLGLLQAGKDYLRRFGGHAQAAGCSLAPDQVKSFKAVVLEAQGEKKNQPGPVVKFDAEVSPNLLSWETLNMLQDFEPFGEGNTKPRFVVKKLRLADWRPVGSKQEHAKCTLEAEGEYIDAIGFGLADKVSKLEGGVNVLGALEVNTFRERRSLQLQLIDVVSAAA